MAEVEPWFEDVFNAAQQLLSQATATNQEARVDSRQIADRCGRYPDEVLRAIRWLESDGWLKVEYRKQGYGDVAEVYWVKDERPPE
jgi:hypothetical protein